MTLSIGFWFILFATILATYGQNKPSCSVSKRTPRTVVCTSGSKSYILKRGLVSDNAQTYSISLNNCKITAIEYTSFEYLPRLQIIDLSRNKLTRVRSKVFDALNNMKQLNLSNNLIDKLEVGLFDQMPNLQLLELQGNMIWSGDGLPKGVFDSLKKLIHLDLSSNNIESDIDPKLFEQNRMLEYIDLSNNKMADVPAELLQSQKKLKELRMNNCTLIDMPETLKHLENLENLYLANNLIETVTRSHLKELKNLKIIVLRKNNINKIPEDLFQDMTSLNNIDLSHNSIEYVPINAFRRTAVKNLNLANNRFTYLTPNFCLELKNTGALLKKFYFNENPFQCPCLLDVLNEVKSFNIEYNSAKYDGRHAVCVTGDDFNCQRQLQTQESFISFYDKLV